MSRGLWHCPKEGDIEVAIKVLQPGASEDDKVKFLQEAAVMGQFFHPNVISLHGVVTLGEPVSAPICIFIIIIVNYIFIIQAMIIMEMMKNGDLRQNLISLRPM